MWCCQSIFFNRRIWCILLLYYHFPRSRPKFLNDEFGIITLQPKLILIIFLPQHVSFSPIWSMFSFRLEMGQKVKYSILQKGFFSFFPLLYPAVHYNNNLSECDSLLWVLVLNISMLILHTIKKAYIIMLHTLCTYISKFQSNIITQPLKNRL